MGLYPLRIVCMRCIHRYLHTNSTYRCHIYVFRSRYHSIFEWFHPLYLADKAAGYATSRYVDEVYLPQAKEINTLCPLYSILLSADRLCIGFPYCLDC